MGNSKITKYIATDNETFKFENNRICKPFGSIKVFKQMQTDKRIFEKVFRLSNQQCNNIYELLMQEKSSVNEYFLHIYHVKMDIINDYCTSMHNELSVYFSSFSQTLQQRISKRRQRKQKFTLIQILKIFQILINGISFLHNTKKFYPYLNTTNIVFDYDQNIKINNIILANCISQTDSNLKFYKSLNPTFASSIRQNFAQTFYNPYQADIFYIGLILFEIITMKPLNLYQRNSQIRYQLRGKQKVIESKQLIQLILKLLAQYSEQRPKLQQIKIKFMQIKNLNNVHISELKKNQEGQSID